MNTLVRIATAAAVLATIPALAQTSGPKVGQAAPRLQVKDLSGKTFSLQSEAKNGPVFVSYWATWCAPCQEEFPLVSGLAKRWGPKGVKIISVAIKDKEPAVRKFVSRMRPAQRVAIDTGNKVYSAWDLPPVPASYLVGKGGKIVGFYDQFDAKDLKAIDREFQVALKAYGKGKH